jgi:hypothetical protein
MPPAGLRAAGLSMCVMGLAPPGACTEAPDDAVAPDVAERADAGPERDPLCVDAGRYSVTDDVVVDTRTSHRLWQRLVSVRLPWDEAARYCDDLDVDGMRGWRLPTPAELSAIRYKPGGLFGGGSSRHYCIPSIDQAAFPDTPAELFWTSRKMPDDTAWYVGFDDGRSHRDTRTDPQWVRCTHDPLPDER